MLIFRHLWFLPMALPPVEAFQADLPSLIILTIGLPFLFWPALIALIMLRVAFGLRRNTYAARVFFALATIVGIGQIVWIVVLKTVEPPNRDIRFPSVQKEPDPSRAGSVLISRVALVAGVFPRGARALQMTMVL